MGAPVDRKSIDTAGRLHRLAQSIEAGRTVDPAEAAWLMLMLRELVDKESAPDPRYMRRTALRRIWRKFYPGLARTTAARLLAVEWRRSLEIADPLPGTMAEYFQRLDRARIRPAEARTIMNDLDRELWPGDGP